MCIDYGSRLVGIRVRDYPHFILVSAQRSTAGHARARCAEGARERCQHYGDSREYGCRLRVGSRITTGVASGGARQRLGSSDKDRYVHKGPEGPLEMEWRG